VAARRGWTPDEVEALRTARVQGASLKALAATYGCSPKTVYLICAKVTYADGPGPRYVGELTARQIKQIRQLYADGHGDTADLAEWFGRSRVSIAQIIAGERFKTAPGPKMRVERYTRLGDPKFVARVIQLRAYGLGCGVIAKRLGASTTTVMKVLDATGPNPRQKHRYPAPTEEQIAYVVYLRGRGISFERCAKLAGVSRAQATAIVRAHAPDRYASVTQPTALAEYNRRRRQDADAAGPDR
jgi:transposase-like protein